ncbi:MAG: cell wall-active antibiotics response protein, partial [bacterium]|nr:cell wall-active antibiotics response protein [bacterium]
VDFNPGVELELDFHTGATDTTLDLSGLLVNSLDLKTGASSTIITAPEQGHTKASVDAGAASVEVRVPPSAAARIVAETGLAEVDIDTNRFLPSGGGYESADYSTSLNRLDLRIKGGVASFKVR